MERRSSQGSVYIAIGPGAGDSNMALLSALAYRQCLLGFHVSCPGPAFLHSYWELKEVLACSLLQARSMQERNRQVSASQILLCRSCRGGEDVFVVIRRFNDTLKKFRAVSSLAMDAASGKNTQAYNH